MVVVKDVPHPVLQVGQDLGTVTVGVALGQHVPTQPSVMVFKIIQSGCGPQVGLMQKIPFGAVTVAVGQARAVMVVRGHVAAVVVCARQGERKLFFFNIFF